MLDFCIDKLEVIIYQKKKQDITLIISLRDINVLYPSFRSEDGVTEKEKNGKTINLAVKICYHVTVHRRRKLLSKILLLATLKGKSLVSSGSF